MATTKPLNGDEWRAGMLRIRTDKHGQHRIYTPNGGEIKHVIATNVDQDCRDSYWSPEDSVSLLKITCYAIVEPRCPDVKLKTF